MAAHIRGVISTIGSLNKMINQNRHATRRLNQTISSLQTGMSGTVGKSGTLTTAIASLTRATNRLARATGRSARAKTGAGRAAASAVMSYSRLTRASMALQGAIQTSILTMFRFSATIYFLQFLLKSLIGTVVKVTTPFRVFFRDIVQYAELANRHLAILETRFGKVGNSIYKAAIAANNALGGNLLDTMEDLVVLTSNISAQKAIIGLSGIPDEAAIRKLLMMIQTIKMTQPDIAARFGQMMPNILGGDARSFSHGFETSPEESEQIFRNMLSRQIRETADEIKKLKKTLESGVGLDQEREAINRKITSLMEKQQRLSKTNVFTAKNFRGGENTLEFTAQTLETYADEEVFMKLSGSVEASINRMRSSYFVFINDIAQHGVYEPIRERFKELSEMAISFSKSSVGRTIGENLGNYVSDRLNKLTDLFSRLGRGTNRETKSTPENAQIIYSNLKNAIAEGIKLIANDILKVMKEFGIEDTVQKYFLLIADTVWGVGVLIKTGITLLQGLVLAVYGILGIGSTIAAAIYQVIEWIAAVEEAVSWERDHSNPQLSVMKGMELQFEGRNRAKNHDGLKFNYETYQYEMESDNSIKRDRISELEKKERKALRDRDRKKAAKIREQIQNIENSPDYAKGMVKIWQDDMDRKVDKYDKRSESEKRTGKKDKPEDARRNSDHWAGRATDYFGRATDMAISIDDKLNDRKPSESLSNLGKSSEPSSSEGLFGSILESLNREPEPQLGEKGNPRRRADVFKALRHAHDQFMYEGDVAAYNNNSNIAGNPNRELKFQKPEIKYSDKNTETGLIDINLTFIAKNKDGTTTASSTFTIPGVDPSDRQSIEETLMNQEMM